MPSGGKMLQEKADRLELLLSFQANIDIPHESFPKRCGINFSLAATIKYKSKSLPGF